MEGLYKKVTRGIYQRIPSEFSQDLSSMIRVLLQVNPESRPSCCTYVPYFRKNTKNAYCDQKAKKNRRIGW